MAYWWEYARATAYRLSHGMPLETVPTPGLVLGGGEDAYVHAQARLEHYHAGYDGYAETTPLLVVGSPSFVVGSLAGASIVNGRRRRAAERRAAVQWHDKGTVSLMCTNQAIRIYRPQFGVSILSWPVIGQCHPDPEHWTLTIGFDCAAAPVRLTGLAVPTVALLAAHYLGLGLDDPRLAPLLDADLRPMGPRAAINP